MHARSVMATALVMWADEPTHRLRWHLKHAGFECDALWLRDLQHGLHGAREGLDTARQETPVSRSG